MRGCGPGHWGVDLGFTLPLTTLADVLHGWAASLLRPFTLYQWLAALCSQPSRLPLCSIWLICCMQVLEFLKDHVSEQNRVTTLPWLE